MTIHKDATSITGRKIKQVTEEYINGNCVRLTLWFDGCADFLVIDFNEGVTQKIPYNSKTVRHV